MSLIQVQIIGGMYMLTSVKLFVFFVVSLGRQESPEIDVSSRITLRKNLNCKSFQWYVDNIYPEIDLPKEAKFIGQVSSSIR